MEHNRPCERRFPFYRQVRDYQQEALYQAEGRFLTEPPPAEAKFANRSEAQDWLEKLIGDPDFEVAYPRQAVAMRQNPPEVKVGSATKGIGRADISRNVMRLSNALGGVGMTLPVVLHEFSHFVHSYTDGFAKGQEAHGPEFSAIYLDMVALVCGDHTADRLSEDFQAAGIRVAHKSRRVVDDDMEWMDDDRYEGSGLPDEPEATFGHPGERDSAGAGLIAKGRLSSPTGTRTAEQASAAAMKLANKKMAKTWESSWKAAQTWASEDPEKPKRLMREFAEHNRAVFEAHLAKGGTLPAEMCEFLGLRPAVSRIPEPAPSAGSAFDDQVARTLKQAATVLPGSESGLATRCGKRMPRAKRLCERPRGHRGPCK